MKPKNKEEPKEPIKNCLHPDNIRKQDSNIKYCEICKHMFVDSSLSHIPHNYK